jgi:hypothetical protein
VPIEGTPAIMKNKILLLFLSGTRRNRGSGRILSLLLTRKYRRIDNDCVDHRLASIKFSLALRPRSNQASTLKDFQVTLTPNATKSFLM